jgi:hemolysin activation/secretion protein
LQKATLALEAALRAKGFGLHRVALPPQEVGDTIALNIVKFSVAKVHIEGRSIYASQHPPRLARTARGGPNFMVGHPDSHRE